MRSALLLTTLSLCLGGFPALAARPSAADLATLNRNLNPTPTPNLYGLDSHVKAPGQDIDQQGNHIFITPEPSPDSRERHLAAAMVTPTPAFLPLWTRLRDFEGRINSSEQSGLISTAHARDLRKRVGLLKIKYGLGRSPDGAVLSGDQIKMMTAELDKLKKSLLK